MARQEWEDAHSHVYGDDPIANAVAFFHRLPAKPIRHDEYLHIGHAESTPPADERQHVRVALGGRGLARRSSPAQPRFDREDEGPCLDQAGRHTRRHSFTATRPTSTKRGPRPMLTHTK